jgi:hypothetical protein
LDNNEDDLATSLRIAIVTRLRDNARFHRDYLPPVDWTLDRPDIRNIHADRIDELANQFERGEITASELYELARIHTGLTMAYLLEHP